MATARMPVIAARMLLAAQLMCCSAAFADDDKQRNRTIPCVDLLDLHLPNTRITTAQSVPAGSFTPPGATAPIPNLASFCRVTAVIAPSINVEVWLPASGWNGKFNGVGNGGYAGFINYGAMAEPLRRGYATASTDTGHVGASPFDATSFLGRPDLVVDHFSRAIHEMTVKAKLVVRAHYGARPRHSYFSGCSGGGHQGLMEAQRYPGDYDGIISGAPAYNITNMHAWFTWSAHATLLDPASYLPSSKLALIEQAALAKCDAADGLTDGIIDDPRRCPFDPAALQCTGPDAPNCLTAAQVQTVKRLYQGPRNPRTGEQLYPGVVPGSETGPGGWSLWITGSAPGNSFHGILAGGLFRYAGFEDPSWDWKTFDFDRDWSFMHDKLGAVADADDPNLRRFRARGGKLIMYHGWSDPAFSALNSIDYYERVLAFNKGGHRERGDDARGATEEFFRFFLVPGMQHCGGGSGPNTFDALTALEQWVEQDLAPARIIATGGAVPTRSRPLCPYPAVARYTGAGSADDAANFVCHPPRRQHGRHDRDHDHDD